jgi:peroxiredoxin
MRVSPPLPLLLSFLLSLLLAVGCSPGRRGGGGGGGDDDDSANPSDDDDDDAAPGDPDGDGLDTSFEEQIGTDPNDEDSDGDGFEDGDEYLDFFLPWDASDQPYIGGYPRGPLPDEIDGDGWHDDQVTLNWTAEDRWGQELQLHRFYGNVVVVEVAAEWCGPCQASAVTLEAEYQERKDEGFVVIQLLLDGLNLGSEPDLERWADTFGLTIPLINDHSQTLTQHYVPTGSYGIPNYTILDRELVIRDHFQEGGSVNWSLVDSLLSEPAPSVEWPLP